MDTARAGGRVRVHVASADAMPRRLTRDKSTENTATHHTRRLLPLRDSSQTKAPPFFTAVLFFVLHVFLCGYIFSLVICSMAAIFCSSLMSLRETISWIRPRKLG